MSDEHFPIDDLPIERGCPFCASHNLTICLELPCDDEPEAQALQYIFCLHCDCEGPKGMDIREAVEMWDNRMDS